MNPELRNRVTAMPVALSHRDPLYHPHWAERGFCLLLLVGSLTALYLAFQLHPDARGYGTHEQLGLAPCGMMKMLSIPCPSCGMTTSWALAAHGRLIDSFLNQPFGLFLFFAAVGAAPVLCAVILGKLSVFAVLEHRKAMGVAIAVLIAFVASWIYKIVLVS